MLPYRGCAMWLGSYGREIFLDYPGLDKVIHMGPFQRSIGCLHRRYGNVMMESEVGVMYRHFKVDGSLQFLEERESRFCPRAFSKSQIFQHFLRLISDL
jgi:hypothetical protein